MTEDLQSLKNSRRKRLTALASVGASAGLTLAKLAAGLTTGSLALISEGCHNALDIAVSATTYYAVREADKPADEEHPFGHAKIEAIAALAQTGFLFALAIGVVYVAIERLIAGEISVDINWAAFAAIILSIAVDSIRFRALTRVARETKSAALAAVARQLSSDLVATVLVLVGLAAARFGFVYGDALAALGVAFFIAFAGYHLGKRTIDALLDAAPTEVAAEVRRIVAGLAGVGGVEFLRLRHNGPKIVGELGVFVPRTSSIERVAQIKGAIESALAARWPEMSLVISADPRAFDDETILERVLLAAARRRLFVHHVAVQHIDGRVCVSLDLEVDGEMRLGAAHAVASGLEHAIRAEVGAEIEVETHIEPLETRELAGQPAYDEATRRLVETLTKFAQSDGVIADIHNVRLRIAGGRGFAIFHGRAHPEMSVAAAHAAVDAIERATRAEMPQLNRVVGHVEPFRSGFPS